MHKPSNKTASSCPSAESGCLSRRHFLLAGATAAALPLGQVFPGRVLAEDESRIVQLAHYPVKPVGRLSRLEVDQPIFFHYPHETDAAPAMLIKLGEPAGGGVGADQDVVAFSTICTHLGGELDYNGGFKIAACGEHLTTFDLRRHGMVIAGHATESLPQIFLQTDGDEILAAGVVGLLYGYHHNLVYVTYKS